ncbi:MAG: hypothetical protein AUJ92_08210 [Armatimonadetes bacterium CG2_30_59_28]|nr:hypothetical protein [Armatimonadota bacterium]OIO95289.1 MAG: hypothetical protein AUJ92_08210 [Armatimonadetes bacterium CG2_30_59_28]PIU67188.1 MAG: hypothetical protein COS85_01700 [Armatimonadetes bacterium CG07_land_8_20_14_0_80_59_28]PIX43961.1 MAG: hypothetical protein COZ56_05850 [Armatimonadetes bacterium CG_4_8_14_3_um_filter_58_9]PIY43422.1 MAG: hypothetical protein COZ05_11085 [Armatimonadetes bacterium CG_4_10_14_3_um_filter_59_10]
MKTLKSHFLLLFVMILSSVAQTDNLLSNSSFEEGTELPHGWTLKSNADAEGTCARDASMARTGQYSMRFQKTNGRGFFTLDLTDSVKLEPGKEYEVRGYVHISEASLESGTYFVIRQYPEGSQQYIPPNIFGSHDQRVAIRTRPGEWSIRSTVFTARPKAARVEITLVVTGNPCTVYWDDLYVGPPIPPSLNLPTLEPEKLVSEEEVYKRLAQRPNATGEVKTINGQPALLISGEPTPPLLHLMCFWRPFSSDNGDFGRAGLHVHVCPVVLAPYLRDQTHLWKGRGEYNFAPADEVLMYALRADPDGYLVPDLVFIGAYPGWGDEHPDEVCQDEKGLKAIGKSVHNTRYGEKLEDPMEFWCPSFFSEVYRRDAADAARAYVERLQSTPLFKAVVGFTISGGDDGQFSMWRRSGPAHEPDYSPAARRGFVAYLRGRYVNEQRLRDAWRDPGIAFDTVTLPSSKERNGEGTFRDPSGDTRLADHHRFLSHGSAELVRLLGQAAKDASGKPVFCTTYWGAHTIGGMNNNHYDLRHLLNSTAIDIFHAPAGYGPWRRPGWTGFCSGIVGSMSLHNKVFLQELDLRTFTKGYPDEAYGYFLAWAKDAEEFSAIHRREMGNMMAWGVGAWYYDMAGGWFHDGAIMQDIMAVKDAYGQGLADRADWHPDVAVIVDEESTHWIHENGFQVNFAAVNHTQAALATSGVPFNTFLLDDLNHPKLADYKIYLFLNCYRMSEAQAAFIETKFKRDGRTLMWVYAPGYATDGGLSSDRVSKLVGMKLTYAPEWGSLACEAAQSDHPLSKNLLPLQGNAMNSGKFSIVDEQAIPLARYVTGGEVAIAAREFPAWRSVYIAAPGALDPNLLNNVARWSSAYVCSSPGDVVFINSHFLSVHGVTGGKRTFALPRRSTVTDMATAKTIAKDVTSFEADVPLQRTRWFRVE